MALLDFTSYEEIRAVLGVSELELEDATLALPLYHQMLLLDLESISESLATAYLTAAELTPNARSAAEQKLVDVTQVYSSYSVSKTLLSSLPLFAPKQITDGRAEQERFTDLFAETRVGVEAGLGMLRARLRSASTALGLTVIGAVTRVYVASAGIATDPVTGA